MYMGLPSGGGSLSHTLSLTVLVVTCGGGDGAQKQLKQTQLK